MSENTKNEVKKSLDEQIRDAERIKDQLRAKRPKKPDSSSGKGGPELER